MTKMRDYYDDYWRDVARTSDTTEAMRRWSQQRMKQLVHNLSALPSGGQVLDAGCGLGRFSDLIAQQNLSVVGIDISASPLYQANDHKHERIMGFLAASVEGSLPFRESTFDAIWTTEVIEHLLRVDEAFAEFRRVLKPNGLLILTTPFHNKPKNLILSVYGYEKHYDPVGPHIRFFTKRSLGVLLDQNGMVPLKWGGVGRFWPLYMSHFVVARKASASHPAPSTHG